MINLKSGTSQWIFQRLSNLFIVIVCAALAVFFYLNPISNYTDFISLLQTTWFKVVTSIALVVFALNSVLAGWQIAGDYVKQAPVNKLFNTLCIAISLATMLFGVYAFWA